MTTPYQKGRDAYAQCREMSAAEGLCPYGKDSGSGRVDWWSGWLDARTEERVPSMRSFVPRIAGRPGCKGK